MPTHVELPASKGVSGYGLCGTAGTGGTIDRSRLREKACVLDEETLEKVDRALEISFGL